MQTLLENARQAWEDRYGAGRHPAGAVQEALRDLLGLAEIPVHVEGFDISHIQGSQTVASVVVWEGGRPRRAAYRRMRIKNAAPGDDYAAMSEAVLRRYRRQAAEGRRLPDLVLIDGGRGQLGAATAALAELGIETVPAVALAKRQEDLFVPGRVEPLPLSEGSPVRLLLTRIRDEAHRFAISYHRQRRRRRTLSSALLEVPGIGQQRARLLLREFGSLEGVRNAHRQDLVRVVGRGVARALEAHLVRDKRPSA